MTDTPTTGGAKIQQAYVAIVEKAAGNGTVGTRWKETRIFGADTPIEKVVKWAERGGYKENDGSPTRLDIILTRPCEVDTEDE